MTAVLGLAILLAAAPSSASPQPSAEADSRRTEPTAAQAVAAGTARPGEPTTTTTAATRDGVRRLTAPPVKGKAAEAEYAPHTVLVKFKAGTSASARGRVAGRIGGKLSTDASTAGYVKITTTGPALKAAAALRGDATVAAVSLDYRRTESKVPNDYYYSVYQKTYMSTIRLPQAWDVQSSATGVVIAIVDTGVDTGHPDLVGRTVAGYNAVANNSNVTDSRGHGTMVAGIAAANTNNSWGVAGAAYNGRIMPIMVFTGQYAYDSDIAEGVIWAVDHGAKIVNMSLGGSGQTPVLHDAIKYAVGKGVLVVAAAGNTGGNGPHYPAMYPEVLTVGATDHAGRLTDFSSWGDHVDIAAPGFDIISTHSRTTEYGPSFTYGIGAGTSYSSPLVAGIAALVRAKYPTLTVAQVIEKLKSTSRDAGPRGIDPYYGSGVVDAYRALGGAATSDFSMQGADGNDMPAQAEVIPSTALAATTGIEGDVDWYKYAVPADYRVTFTLTPPPYNGNQAQNFDGVLALYDADLRLIQEVDSTENTYQTEIITQPLRRGTYYVKVRNYNGAPGTGFYELRATTATPEYRDFPPFNNGVYFDTGNTFPEATAIGDVTGDGRPDALLTTSYYFDPENDYKLFVFAQNADGTLSPSGKYDTHIPYSNDTPIAIGDFNGDGRNDVALGAGVGVEVFLQQADGTLAAGALVPETDGARFIAAADMDADGDADLVYSAGGVFQLTSAGGTFTKSAIAADTMTREVEVGDLNSDGRLDVATSATGGVAVHLAGAEGWTTTKYTYGGGSTPFAVEVADISGDGRADIAATIDSGETLLIVFRQQADGTMSASQNLFAYTSPDGVESGDWDKDGRLDLFVAHGGWGMVSMYRQRADGTLEAARAGGGDVAQHSHQNAISIGDLNGDGYPDVATAANYNNGIWIGYNVNGAAPRGVGEWVWNTSIKPYGKLGRTPKLTVTMRRPLDPATVNSQTVRLVSGRTGRPVELPVSYDAATGTITVTLWREADRPGTRPGAAPVLPDITGFRLVLDGVKDTAGGTLTGYTVWYLG
ncbi:hypothetical protein CS0771_12080 [Catellatospora sp. IY07-71]|uniref:S8 family serine peptidase n=1 Tax=Catellatospora sp. IY07-71 TaxID=2728827 RepID=UPI001BB3F967|nr:S8 family serine peptidase [Catellatospora sp. IY07-71]BCJ71664.1 hypothetical protein CS0771_12080 [Catellatospora sp. IY07-71]